MVEILLQSTVAGLGTCLGAGAVLLFGPMRSGVLSLLLGFASGIMAAVVIIDLLPTSLHYGQPVICILGFLTGFLFVTGMDYFMGKAIPGHRLQQIYLRMGYLIALGIALHDLPEGIAIAAGYSASTALGPVLVLAIGMHNIPEGMATAAPLKAGGASGRLVLALNALVSLVTPLGTLLGLFILQVSKEMNALLLALAAGAMIYIILEKLLPASIGNNGFAALTGLVTGFLFMYGLHSLL
ncbi:ZIP family metal transporter [Desulfotruncus alcoholivorax]|uniref:ZIP family metal transporter n=1 Tax=Desulfotruncus alcoholivorax TaxID=265477 RepID=UPI0003FB76DF|nr:ZIP family metal transporter [Desulfotruncus alcoholivorax]